MYKFVLKSSIIEQTLQSMESDLFLLTKQTIENVGENKVTNNSNAKKQKRGDDEHKDEEQESTNAKTILKIQIKKLIKELIGAKGEKDFDFSSIAKSNKCYQCDFASSHVWNIRPQNIDIWPQDNNILLQEM